MSDKRNISAAVPIEAGKLTDKLDAVHPLIYADQLSQLVVGPFVSKFTIATEDHGRHLRLPVVSIVMPTNMLHQLALQIVATLSDQTNQTKMNEMQDAFKQALSEK